MDIYFAASTGNEINVGLVILVGLLIIGPVAFKYILGHRPHQEKAIETVKEADTNEDVAATRNQIPYAVEGLNEPKKPFKLGIDDDFSK